MKPGQQGRVDIDGSHGEGLNDAARHEISKGGHDAQVKGSRGQRKALEGGGALRQVHGEALPLRKIVQDAVKNTCSVILFASNP